ncbi:MAG: hypothetical protein Q8L47_01295 [bacterium]|nr:hypothetical protein [bacterium]
MNIQVKCALCKKIFLRPQGRVNEAKKFKWKQYCSKQCMTKSKVTSLELHCSNAECENRFYRCPNQILKVDHSYCSRSCAAHINDQKFPKRGPGFKICANCGVKIKGSTKYCSRKCLWSVRKIHTPQALINKLQFMSKALGRTPAKREAMFIVDACIREFGSWNKAILAAGLMPHRSHSQRMYKRSNTVASDGHNCDSISEAIIDDWLTKNNISHKREAPYPKTGHRADWSISEKTFIEYFGLAKDSPRYDRAIKRKRMLCRKSGIRLIEIYAKDLYPIQMIENKLKSLVVKI